MKFNIGEKNILLKNLWNVEWNHNSVDHIDVKNEKISSDTIIEELGKIILNKEELEAMRKELERIDAEILKELKKFVKPKLAFLKNEILWTSIVKELVATLQNKIKELQEAWKDTYGNMKFVVPYTQLALLNVWQKNKIDNWWNTVAWNGDFWNSASWRGDFWNTVAWRGDFWNTVAWTGASWNSASWRGDLSWEEWF